MKALLAIGIALLSAWLAGGDAAAAPAVAAELPPGLTVPGDARPGPSFDVDRATAAWLSLLTPEQRERSDAYFEGGYWLELWGTLYTVGAMALLLVTGTSRRLRDTAERLIRHPGWVAALYAPLFIVAVFVLELPFSIYAGFVREHAYGLSNLTLGGWLRESLIGLAVTLVVGTVALALLYAGIRRSGARWWLWATGFTFALTLFMALVYPVAIAPLFNDYKPLPPGPVREAVSSLARANQIPTDHLEWFDASRQTKRISANVAGLGGVARINLNDNLLERTSLPEIRAVLGHEMGHYVLNHPFRLAVYLTLAYGLAFGALHVAFDRALARWGNRLRVRDRADPAALPLAAAILVVVLLLLAPLTNTIVRTAEAEADAFGLNAAREPQGFAMVSMRLSAYRKLAPGPLEEALFFDHPSGYERVRRAMVWQKENGATRNE